MIVAIVHTIKLEITAQDVCFFDEGVILWGLRFQTKYCYTVLAKMLLGFADNICMPKIQ